ncbi:hypothetical protein EJV47_08620 [Hymenobacter gummosus]|uniref:Uncharacterized protein n=1 Tax=Hymenobacter gummosus TaxID=1776032 RepID=A0A3S0H647_9BACT|nr:hypothetical protein [Hymenobacter gummosus]RTQ50686.1 hypothetical protein EJV47_08620 [Hymenobacter gummosus]
MALPKKQGLRKLQVGTTGYYWKLRNERNGEMTITIGEVANPNCRLTVHTNWYDPWLMLGDRTGQRWTTGIITPALVRQAINYALSQQWGEEGNRNWVLNYQNETFSIRPPFTNSI